MPKKKTLSDVGKTAIERTAVEMVANAGHGLGRPEDGVGDRIRHAREKRNWTQEAVSRLTKQLDIEGRGISRSVLAYYEKGRFKPGTRELRILYATLGVTPNWLVLGEEDPNRLREFRKRFKSDDEFFGALVDTLKKLDSESLNGVASLAFAATANASEIENATANIEKLTLNLLGKASEQLDEIRQEQKKINKKKLASKG